MRPLVLFFPFDLLSHTLRCLSLAKAIEEETEILFPESQKYSQHIKEAAYLTFPYKGPPVDRVMRSARKFNFDWIQKDLLEEQFLEQVHIIQTLKPNAIIGDATFTLRMAAAYTQTPFISIVNGYMTPYYGVLRRLPPTHIIPRLFAFLPKHVFNSVSKRAEKYVLRRVHQPFRELAKKYNVASKLHLLEELEGDMTLISDLPALFPQKNLPDSYHFIGPLFHADVVENTYVRQWMQNGKKTLLVTIGSSGDIQAFRFLMDNELRKYNILIVGDTQNQIMGDNIISYNFLPLGSLLKDISLMICHGGNGSIYQALSADLPVLCQPFNFEQEWNLQGLEILGFGERLSPNPMHRLRQIHAWSNKKEKNGNQKVSQKISQSKGRDKFKTLFIQFLKKHSICPARA